MKNLFSIFTIGLLSIFCQVNAAQADACEKDRAKYCPQYGPKDPERLYCLRTVESQISSNCKASLKNIKGSVSDFIDECTADYQKFCTATPRGQGRVIECLRDHSKELDFECRKMVNNMPRHEVK